MPVSKGNFVHGTNMELEGVATSSFTVDFINSMAAETADLSSGSAVAGLEAVRAVIGQHINILSEGPLVESNKQKTYTVRTDSLGTLISAGTLQASIRALNGAGSVTATISSATVTATDIGILTAAVV
jgi:archaellum component FlaF (FlaF/FlaG flagellin family)